MQFVATTEIVENRECGQDLIDSLVYVDAGEEVILKSNLGEIRFTKKD